MNGILRVVMVLSCLMSSVVFANTENQMRDPASEGYVAGAPGADSIAAAEQPGLEGSLPTLGPEFPSGNCCGQHLPSEEAFRSIGVLNKDGTPGTATTGSDTGVQ